MRMLQAIGWAALGTGFTFLMTTLGAAMVFFFSGEPRPKFQRAMLGFAAGVMTAASVWSLLLPAIEQAVEDGQGEELGPQEVFLPVLNWGQLVSVHFVEFDVDIATAKGG